MTWNPFREPAQRPHLDDEEPVSEADDAPPAKPRAHAVIDATAHETALLPRNFTIGFEDRVRGLVSGLPAYVRRKRHIEDLEAELLTALAEGASDDDLAHRLEALNELVVLHNRYYPTEANLPLCPDTGGFLELGEPWSPLPRFTAEALRVKLREAPPTSKDR